MGERRRHLIAVAQLECVEAVEADRGNADDDLPLFRGWIRDLFDFELFRSAELAELRYAHRRFLASILATLLANPEPIGRRLWHK
jgi:hypothetical protein